MTNDIAAGKLNQPHSDDLAEDFVDLISSKKTG